jgi:hypothetical protein
MQYKYTTLEDQEIIFRALSAEEADRIYQSLSQKNIYLEEYVFNLITDDAYDVDELAAGIIPTVIYAAYQLSGVLKDPIDLPNDIEASRDLVNSNAYYLMYATIVKAQPSYTLKTARQLSLKELMEEFAFSEMVLGSPTIDTKKARASIEKTQAEANTAPGVKTKRGINSVTAEELEVLKQIIGTQEYGGMPRDEF